MPSVAATAACCGLRPVAKAFGDISGMTYTFGIGRLRLATSRSTTRYRRCSGPTACARYIEQDDLVREPVRHEVHDDGEAERDDESAGAAEQFADHQQDAAEQAEEQCRLDAVCHTSILRFPSTDPRDEPCHQRGAGREAVDEHVLVSGVGPVALRTESV